ncbi:ATP-dependent RNA helicase DbpA [Bdellovibrionota bacterium FG-2]
MSKRKTLSFSSLPLSSELIEVTQELGFESLTPIQAQAIPHLLEGKDLVGQAKTGSGKTAAFALPILQRMHKTHGFNVQNSRDLYALVLCPTRELCTQVAREIRKLGRRHLGLQVLILSGGTPLFPQLSALEKGAHIAVGTPGRVLDLVNRRKLALSRLATVVLDEADRMLDMGFEEDMKKILAAVPKQRQMVFFSATFPRSISSMSLAYQQNPVRVTIEEEEAAAPDIRQISYEIKPETRVNSLLWLLKQNQPESAIIFCNFKASVAELTETLLKAGISCACIHGDLEQEVRDRVMAKFRNHSTRILIATDVAARGLDIENLDMVINYELSPDPEVYVHRIGRTGRAGKKGLAVSFVSSKEKSKIERIQKFTQTPIDAKTAGTMTLESQDSPRSSEPRTVLHAGPKMETLFIAGGRKHKMRPGDVLGALTGDAGGLPASDIGKIEVHDYFTYVAVSKNVADLALERLKNGRIKGKRFRVEKVR